MKTKIHSYDYFDYREVWEVLTWRDGCKWNTRFTGKYIKANEEESLDGTIYFAVSISTEFVKKLRTVEFIEVELI